MHIRESADSDEKFLITFHLLNDAFFITTNISLSFFQDTCSENPLLIHEFNDAVKPCITTSAW